MVIHDPISDLLTRIRNSYMAGLEFLKVQKSDEKIGILNVLMNNGYILGFFIEENNENVIKNKMNVIIFLKYVNFIPSIDELKRISKPSYRIYLDCTKIFRFSQGFGITILSTSIGIISNKDVRLLRCGGEVFCKVV